MANQTSFFPLGKFLFRTPSFSMLEDFEQLLKSPFFQEALYLASPSLYNECLRKGFILKENELKSLYKYYIRTTTRCSPFGLFAGCSVGQITNNTSLQTSNLENYHRITRFDMSFLFTLINKIEHIESIRCQLRYRINTSLYLINDEIRYIEYTYQGTRATHNLVRIEKDPYLDKIVKVSQQYIEFNKLVHSIIDDEIDQEEAADFINTLIECQVLRSEFEIHVTGENILDILIHKLGQLENTESICTSLKKLACLLSDIDNAPIGTTIDIYSQIINEIKQLDLPFEKKYLFQTDLFKPAKAEISHEIIKDITKILEFVNGYTQPKINLEEFKQRFYERYEEQEVPLVEVLDSDFGIGYGYSNSNIDFNPLIKNIFFPTTDFDNNEYKTDLSQIFADKILKEKWLSTKEIVLTDKEIDKQKGDWEQSSESLHVSISLIKDESNENLFSLNTVSSEATRTLSRFSHLDNEILQIVRRIADWEQEKNPEAIIAAIVHLPTSRIGNVTFRPNTIRKYEIPYLANSLLSTDYQIPITDLLVSVRNDKLCLISKKYQKEIIPKLDNAHNYALDTTPIYHFLCAIQKIKDKNYMAFRNDTLSTYFDYSPRLRYKNFILKKACWKIDYSKINEHQIKSVKDLNNYLIERNIPRYISYEEGDKVLQIDCEQELALNLLFDFIKKQKMLLVEESFNYGNNMVQDCKGMPYANEIIIPFLKK